VAQHRNYDMSINVFFEVPIILLSFSLWISKLSNTYSCFAAGVDAKPTLTFFLLQLLLSTLWIICALLTQQWLVLITTCNSFLCQVCIIFFLYKSTHRNDYRNSCEFAKLANSPYDTQTYSIGSAGNQHVHCNLPHLMVSDTL